MTGPELEHALAIFGWTRRGLAARQQCAPKVIERLILGSSPIPDDLAAWVADLLAYMAAHPMPICVGQHANRVRGRHTARSRQTGQPVALPARSADR